MAAGRLALTVLASAALAIATTAALPVAGEDSLVNGGFESGSAGWGILGGGTVPCTPHEGNGALGLVAATSPARTLVQQEVSGALPAGQYTISGWTKIQDGGAEIQLTMAFNRPNGSPRGITVPVSVATGATYTEFSFTELAGFAPESVTVSLSASTSSAGEVCFDSFELTTPGLEPTSTTSPTSTLAPSATATATETVASTPTHTPTSPPAPGSTSTPSATSSPSPPAATRTSTPAPSATSTPGSGFTNGGFEEGLTGWSKYGGDLMTTGSARSGETAGLLTSYTESTKWAYQAVPVDPSQHYEFSAHLDTGDGLREAYLRISWYPTTDGTGPALSTTDSSERVTGSSSGFVFLTTGAAQPPAGAASARVRVLLAPSSAAPASLTIDDVSFVTTTAPSPTPAPSGTPPPTTTLPATPPSVPLLGASIATPPASTDVPGGAAPAVEARAANASPAMPEQPGLVAVPTIVTQVESARAAPRASAAAPLLPENRFAAPGETEESLPWAWLAGIALVVVGLGGVYVQNKQASR